MPKEDLRKKVLYFAYKHGFQKNGKKLEESLKIKKSTADYILDKLKEEKYYSKLRYEINFDSVGLGKCAWLFISVKWDNLKFAEFIEKALKMPQISVIADVTGDFDLALKIFGPSVQSINSFVLGFEKIFEDIIIDTNIYFASKEYKRHYLKSAKSSTIKLNKIDYKILCKKSQNPKLSILELSESLGIHRNTISNKWKSYWKNKVLLKKTIELTSKGYEKLGLGLKAFIIIKPNPGKQEEIT
ncbi:MAG: AsnC family transcriptional regulator, partial [Candidatus Diapherotrites archaeon]|nr:AsnC family transcriptional regulator [Candidatus Diapherotrites archaeon]